MIVERFIVVGIKYNRKMITDIYNNSNSNSNGNGLDLNISLNFIDEQISPMVTDHKKFDIKEDAIQHISVIKARNYIDNSYSGIGDIASWTIISVYDEIYDLVQIRKYKILKLKKKLLK